jgi:RNA polymerase sigma factor (TIGR02999 family)
LLDKPPVNEERVLFDRVYDELKRMAVKYLHQERPDHTLQPTALVHETYIRLAAGDNPAFVNRAYFFRAAARAMQRILVEHARRRHRKKRGGERQRRQLDSFDPAVPLPHEELLALDEALAALARDEPAKAELVQLRFFAGLTVEEAAQCQGISKATADRHWAYARAWLFDYLSHQA